jgi:hypothetical protein
MRIGYDRTTTTINREWLAQIIGGTKKIEYRQIKPYWTKRFEAVSPPVELRLLNGMIRPVPEVTVLIHKITTNRSTGQYRLHVQESSWIQALGQAATETQTVSLRCIQPDPVRSDSGVYPRPLALTASLQYPIVS